MKKQAGVLSFGKLITVADPSFNPKGEGCINKLSIYPGIYRCILFSRGKDLRNDNIIRAQIVSVNAPVSDKELYCLGAWKRIGSIEVESGFAGFFADGTHISGDEEWISYSNFLFSSIKQGNPYAIIDNDGGVGTSFCAAPSLNYGKCEVFAIYRKMYPYLRHEPSEIVAVEIRF